MELESLGYALCATGFTFAMTCVGSAAVFLFRGRLGALASKLSLGFAAGIMIGASVWSLLIPAMDLARENGQMPGITVALGFVLGSCFMILLDNAVPHLHPLSDEAEGPRSHLDKHCLLFLAITIHNIPEGMAVGVAFAAASSLPAAESLASAVALAIGMGIQNIPEGTAVSLPLLAAGNSRLRSFSLGAISGVVEPVSAALSVLLSFMFMPVLPCMLSFAAGAMLYVVVEELIPEARLGDHSDMGTVSVLLGFLVMMLLDTALA